MFIKRPTKKWTVLLIVLLAVAIYLNRSYAYFFDFLENNKIMPLSLQNNFNFKSQNNPGTKLVYVALGDSLTRGVGVQKDEQTFPYQVAQSLSKSAEVELINLGIPGVRTGELVDLELPLVEQLDPNLITISVGTNDILSENSAENFSKNYVRILDKLGQIPNAKILVINIPDLSNSKIMLLPYNVLFDWRIKQFNSIIKNLVELKDNKNIIYVDLYAKTKTEFHSEPAYFSGDGFHPSEKGYKLWSEIIYANLNF